MDRATISGLVLGALLVVGAIALGGSPAAYIDIPWFMVVGGCATAAALLLGMMLRRLLQAPQVVARAMRKPPVDAAGLIGQLVECAEVARRDGIAGLQGIADKMQDPLLVSGIKIMVDDGDGDVREQICAAEVENLLVRHACGSTLMHKCVRYAPICGMMGALMVLAALLANMSGSSTIGAGMARALLSMLYGLLAINIACLPLVERLDRFREDELLMQTIVVKGVMLIQSGNDPRVVAQKLHSFIGPADQQAEAADEEGDMAKAA